MRISKEGWFLALLLAVPAVSMAQEIGIGEYHLPTTIGSSPQGITAGPDGALWFVADGNYDTCLGCVGRITIAGDITLYQTPSTFSDPLDIVAGPDGALWFTEPGAERIGRVTTSGAMTEYALPGGGLPWGIAVGPDGALWFTEEIGNKIGRITTSGSITEYSVPTASCYPLYIAAGPDGALWFTEEIGNKVGRVTTGGSFTEYAVPTAGSMPYGIASGPDGALWFTEELANNIGRITTAGIFTEYALPTAQTAPWLITKGPDGNLWFTEYNFNQIGRIATDGTIAQFAAPSSEVTTFGITTGPDNEIWFTEYYNNNIGEAFFDTAILTATPGSGTVHSAVTFGGYGFGPRETVQIYTSGIGSTVIASATTGLAGAFSTSTALPQSPNGPRIYVAKGLTSGTISTVNFTVNALLVVSPDSGSAGSASTISGYGFSPYETVNLYWLNPGAFLGNGSADVNGTFNRSSAVNFLVPAGAPSGLNRIFGLSDTREGPHAAANFHVN